MLNEGGGRDPLAPGREAQLAAQPGDDPGTSETVTVGELFERVEESSGSEPGLATATCWI